MSVKLVLTGIPAFLGGKGAAAAPGAGGEERKSEAESEGMKAAGSTGRIGRLGARLGRQGRRGLRALRGRSLRNTLLFYNLILIVLVITLVSSSGQYYYRRQFDARELEQITHLQKQVQRSFDERLRAIEQSVAMMLKSPALAEAFAAEDAAAGHSETLRLDRESRVRALFADYAAGYPEYLSILGTDGKGRRYYSNDSYRLGDGSFTREQWFVDALAAPERYNYYFHSAIRNLASWKQYATDSYISLSKAIVDPGTGEAAGVLLVDIELDSVKLLYDDLIDASSANLFFMNRDGDVLLAPENGLAYRVKPEWFEGLQEGVLRAKLEDKTYNVFFRRLERDGLLLLSLYDSAALEAARTQFLYTSLLIGVIALAVAALWSLYYLSAITRPLSELALLMKGAEHGDLNVSFAEASHAEIVSLGRAFNHMIQRIKALLSENSRKEKEKREAEIKILQEQLKPHFLYNTLDTIAWMARKNEGEKILRFTRSLSSFYRIALSRGAEYIPLHQELSIIEHYLEVQSVRYAGLFTYAIDCPEELQGFPVPRMILQPLVENAIYHGFKEAEQGEGLRLNIVAEEAGGRLCMAVIDNGRGMGPEQMAELNRELEAEEGRGPEAEPVAARAGAVGRRPGGNYGIMNVRERLRLSYGQRARLSYAAEPGGGVRVTLCLPELE